MLFNTEKNKSLTILQAITALFIIAGSSLLGMTNAVTCTYIVSFVISFLLLIRIKDTKKIHVSAIHFPLIILFFYSVVSSIWASNRGGHLRYLFLIGALMTFFSLTADYFSENSPEKTTRRMMYLFSAGGSVCALFNIGYWIMYIVPVAGDERFSCGMGSADFLAVFMLLCICASALLIKGNSAAKKGLFILCIGAMLFVLIMAKSTAVWIFAILFALLYIIKKKAEKFFALSAISATALFGLILIFVLKLSAGGAAFTDMFSYAARNLAGYGGGFESSAALFQSELYDKGASAGLFVKLFACSGIVGILCSACILVFSISHFIKLKTALSIVELFATVMVMIIPANGSIAVLLLWTGLTAYNEQLSGRIFKRSFKAETLKKLICVIMTAAVISAILLSQSLMRRSGDMKVESGEYTAAYSLYALATAIDITDSYSPHMAAQSLRLGGNIEMYADKAIKMIDKAIKRDRKNPEHLEEKAEIYYACGEYETAAATYREAAAMAKVSGEYNLRAVEALYETIKQNPKGSSETKRMYAEIAEIAHNTQELDYKKEINDIADKALNYTKGELSGEAIGD